MGFTRKFVRPQVVELFVTAVDAVLVVISGISCAVAYHIATGGRLGKADVYAAASVMVAINFLLLITVQHGYRLKAITNLPRTLRMTLTTWTGLFGALLAIAFTMKVSDEFSRGTTISFYLVGLAILLTWKTTAARWIARAQRTGAFANGRAIMIAEFGLAASSNAIADLGQHGYGLMRVLEIPAKDLASPLLLSSQAPRFEELVAYARENRIEHVFLLINWSRQHAIDSILDALKILPVPVHLVPDANTARFLRYPLVGTGDTFTAELRRAPLSFRECALKRALDLVGASLALIVFAPVMLVTAILIKLSSKGPVFFRQTRHGFGGRAFRIFKFRTMRVLEDGPTIVQAQKNDPRVTPIGKWLRKTSIDELPQIVNVLKGEMSLVGPRPHAAAHNTEYEQIIGNYAYRHHVKPGITGWAQVNGYRGETSALKLMEKRVEYDLWYINNWSIWLDLGILLRTTLAILTRPTAY
ncbi:undecaprenyl-phosphate glucose phosphotransferase [Bradyrhizobium canariense]|uniref:Undecaprenyl-phosphate glucose phosphotransferase n=2 Tax=Bradyrhizobium canariense TaxID=255045 RepID=A0A1X3GJZ5_9BRAD|nr:undecaprenyl-phosphate glucose phosphotransferase [Bradyrhizobium canariense]OSI79325.1 undecaprenyl-phosphate glucose phosphotransferase [Bradyrhizobium canariense]OSI89679.1 undecaprenyl-phosphate glucose phosphotransferase [Bradyrhizobium canariense]OSI90943.1 undecaprenyl-phosphate glucose phosphotransferase [Bradyrhizobium canariense]OSJ04044.1 undecaprenyl-phosphate glucose phosphotransferase [Bradyrhizobium canariense]